MEPDVVTYNTVVNAHAQKGNAEGAVRVFEAMRKQGMEPNVVTYNTVVNAYAQKGDAEGAVRVFETMRKQGMEPDVVSYNTVVNTYAQKGDAEGTVRVFEAMRKQGMKPNVVTYNTVVNTHAQKGDAEGAVRAFEAMRKQGMEPDVVTYTTLLKSLSRRKNDIKLRSVLNEMDHGEIVWDSYTLYAALRCACTVALKEKIFKKYVYMSGTNDYIYRALTQGKGGMQSDKARGLIRAAIERYPNAKHY